MSGGGVEGVRILGRPNGPSLCVLCREVAEPAADVKCPTCGALLHRACMDELGPCHPAAAGPTAARAEPRQTPRDPRQEPQEAQEPQDQVDGHADRRARERAASTPAHDAAAGCGQACLALILFALAGGLLAGVAYLGYWLG